MWCSFQWCSCFCFKSDIICLQEKIGNIIHRNSSCIQPLFSAYRTQLTRKPCVPFERALHSSLEKTLRIKTWHLLRICTWFMPYMAGESGNTLEPVRIYPCRTCKQTVTLNYIYLCILQYNLKAWFWCHLLALLWVQS